MSTVLSKLNAFLDTELEQVICFDGGIDAELFVRERCAIFLILPEDATKNFVASLMIQNLARELFSVANEHGGRLPNRAVFFCDELGTMPPFDILPLFSAGRSRRLTLVPIIQSLAQLERTTARKEARSFATTARIPSSAALRRTARPLLRSPITSAAEQFCPALSQRAGTMTPSLCR